MTPQETLLDLFRKNESLRNPEWENAVLGQLPHATGSLLSETPQVGPDRWPYLFISVDEDSKEPLFRIFTWLKERGIGLAINPLKGTPDFVLNYGMIWNFCERGQFISPTGFLGGQQVQFFEGEKVLAGPPDEKFLPSYVRKIVRQFLNEQGVPSPKIIVISKDRQIYDIAFSLESLGFPPETEHRGILEALSWFFPLHYSLTLLSEKDLPGFVAL
jgi:hypothetical protein